MYRIHKCIVVHVHPCLLLGLIHGIGITIYIFPGKKKNTLVLLVPDVKCIRIMIIQCYTGLLILIPI